MLKEEKELVKKLKDFTSPRDKIYSGIFNNWHKYRISDIDYDKCRLIVYIFNGLLQYPIVHQPIEKVNWELAFVYKGVNGTFAHQKFGFRVYLDGTIKENRANSLGTEILAILKDTLSSLGPVQKIYAKKALNNGEIIVHNKLEDIELAYRYFRREATQKKQSKLNTDDIKKASDHKEAMNLAREAWIVERTHQYNEEAAYFTFISLIEHLTVLFLAFNPVEGMTVTRFARKPWGEKFKQVFPMEEKQISTFYEKLINISNFRRNPSAHGHVTSKYTQASFYFSKTKHRIPISLYDDEAITDVAQADINLKLLDDFLVNIRNNPKTKNIMAYIDEGFDISFLRSDKNKYQELKDYSDDELAEYIEHEGWNRDHSANMDWGFM